jgi:hypothetical protein
MPPADVIENRYPYYFRESKQMKQLLIAAAFVALAMIGGSVSTRAQIVIPPGEQIVCVLHCHGLVFIQLSDGTVIEAAEDAEGEATLESVGSDPDHPANTVFVPVSITVTGDNPNVGSFEFTFDRSRDVNSSTVAATDEAIEAGVELPAVANVYANVTGRIEAFEGTFTNVNECHMQATINSFNPHRHETYTFTRPVELRNLDAPEDQQVIVTIPAGATVTLD